MLRCGMIRLPDSDLRHPVCTGVSICVARGCSTLHQVSVNHRTIIERTTCKVWRNISLIGITECWRYRVLWIGNGERTSLVVIDFYSVNDPITSCEHTGEWYHRTYVWEDP